MRPRTFILVILIVVVLAVIAVLLFVNRGILSGGDDQPNESAETTTQEGEQQPLEPSPTPTPAVFLQDVVIARLDLPVGTRLTEELLDVEQRPNTNIALQGAYTFTTTQSLIGQIIKVDIQRGDAILRPMLAVEASDLASFGSDISLYVDRGRVAVAFPLAAFNKQDPLPIELLQGVDSAEPEKDPKVIDRIAQEKGVAFAMRPGDFVDVMMTAEIVDIDPDFRTALPNLAERIAFVDGVLMFLPSSAQGRLEFIPEINQVVEIVPEGGINAAGNSIPRRVTQLAIQQAEVVWVGSWFSREKLEALALENILNSAPAAAEGEEGEPPPEEVEGAEPQVFVEEFPSAPTRINSRPDVVILSMLPQDALALKWAIEHGMDIDLALRAQGDLQTFDTAGVSIFQVIEQGGIVIQPPEDFDLNPHPSLTGIPVLPNSILDIEVNTIGNEIIIDLEETIEQNN